MILNNKKIVIIACISFICFSSIYFSDKKSFSKDLALQDKDVKLKTSKNRYRSDNDSIVISEDYEKLKINSKKFDKLKLGIEEISKINIFSLNGKEKKYASFIKPENISSNNKSLSQEIVSNNNIYNINIFKEKKSSQRAGLTVSASKDSKISAFKNHYVLLLKQGKLEDSENLLNEYVRKNLKNSWNLAEIASFLEEKKQKNKALQIYRKALEQSPSRIEILYRYAICLYRSNLLEESEGILYKITTLSPDFMLAYYNLGNIYYRQKEYYKALEAFNISVQLNPLSVDSYYNIALILEILDIKDKALKFYAKCIELNPMDAQAKEAVNRLNR